MYVEQKMILKKIWIEVIQAFLETDSDSLESWTDQSHINEVKILYLYYEWISRHLGARIYKWAKNSTTPILMQVKYVIL